MPHPLKIFIIDDDEHFQFSFQRQLHFMDKKLTLQPFNDGEHPLQLLEQNQDSVQFLPDIIFLDINMPIVDGWDFLTAFEKFQTLLPKPVKIFILSSSMDDADVLRSKNHKTLSGYLVKPIPDETLSSILTQI